MWRLADLQPADARAESTLQELDKIEQALNGLRSSDELTEQQLVNVIEIRSYSGQRLVIEDSIPEPWRQRFSAASIGSTRLVAGPYFRDFQKFVMSWIDEMEHLKAHRAGRQEGASK
ncbi:hypothetical protein ACLUS7_17365 [Enterobacterales bacterium BD_CKDN230030183-1A_HGKHYDSX7]